MERLKRTARRDVRDGLLPKTVLDRAPRRTPDDRLLVIVAGMRQGDPELPLAGIATRLEASRERTPRSNSKWYPSAVRMLLERAEKMGLALKGGPDGRFSALPLPFSVQPIWSRSAATAAFSWRRSTVEKSRGRRISSRAFDAVHFALPWGPWIWKVVLAQPSGLPPAPQSSVARPVRP